MGYIEYAVTRSAVRAAWRNRTGCGALMALWLILGAVCTPDVLAVVISPWWWLLAVPVNLFAILCILSAISSSHQKRQKVAEAPAAPLEVEPDASHMRCEYCKQIVKRGAVCSRCGAPTISPKGRRDNPN